MRLFRFFLFTAMGRILDAAAVVLLPGLGYGIPYSWLTVAWLDPWNTTPVDCLWDWRLLCLNLCARNFKKTTIATGTRMRKGGRNAKMPSLPSDKSLSFWWCYFSWPDPFGLCQEQPQFRLAWPIAIPSM